MKANDSKKCFHDMLAMWAGRWPDYHIGPFTVLVDALLRSEKAQRTEVSRPPARLRRDK
jgi:hypothetical protein